MDTVCRTIQEFIAPEQDDKELPALVNVVHPRPVAWHDVIVHISNGLRSEAGQPLPVIPFDEWMKKLEKVSHSSTGKDLDTIVRTLLPVFTPSSLLITYTYSPQSNSFPSSNKSKHPLLTMTRAELFGTRKVFLNTTL